MRIPVIVAWKALPYQGFGRCATCGCLRDEDDQPIYTCGLNHDSMVCVYCFELEHGCEAPNYRRRSRPQPPLPGDHAATHDGGVRAEA